MSASEAREIELSGRSGAADPAVALREALSAVMRGLAAAGGGPHHLERAGLDSLGRALAHGHTRPANRLRPRLLEVDDLGRDGADARLEQLLGVARGVGARLEAREGERLFGLVVCDVVGHDLRLMRWRTARILGKPGVPRV